MKTKQLWAPILALTLALFGVIIISLTPILLKKIIRANLVLTPGSKIFNLWKHFPSLMPYDIYFFNWTNPEDIYNLSVKPKFEQMGPYRFMVNLDKTDIQWNDNGTVTYKPQNYWHYDHSENNGNLEDKVTTLNPVALAAAHKARTWPYLVRKGLSFSLAGLRSTLAITRKVDEFIFTGYPDPLVKIVRTLPFFADTHIPPWDRFAWFYKRNGTNNIDGVYNVGTGNGTPFGKMYNWKYSLKSPYFPSECGGFGDSTGENFEPDSLGEFINIFSPDLCRPVFLQYEGTAEVNGVVGNKYYFGDYMLDNGTKYPENKCFCNGDCLPSGVFNVSSCRYGGPTFVSLPNFYKADPYYHNMIEGLKPDDSKHNFYVIAEPNTGFPLEIRVRVQMNLMLHSVPGVSNYENVPTAFFPVAWIDQQLNLPPDLSSMLRLLQCIPIIGMGIGIFFIVSGFGLSLYFVTQIRKRKVRSKTKECNENIEEKAEEKKLIK